MQLGELLSPPRHWALRVAWLFPVVSPPERDAVVEIDGDQVVGLHRTAPPGIPCLDASDCALVPALINAHTHLEFSDHTAPIPFRGGPFAEWIREVVGRRRHRRSESTIDEQRVLQAGQRELMAGGVGFVGEITTGPMPTQPLISGVSFREAIGLSAGQAESLLATAHEHLERMASTPWSLGLSPHAPYSLAYATLLQLVELARHRGRPIAMHMAESRDEMELVIQRTGPLVELLRDWEVWDEDAIPGGVGMIDYVRAACRAPRALIIHGNYLDTDAWRLMADCRSRVALVHCPRTHAYFGHDCNPLSDAIASGVRVVLGTDSRASNPDLSMWREMAYLAECTPWLSSDQILSMGSIDPASVLGLPRWGSLAVGSGAHFSLVRLRHELPLSDPTGGLFAVARQTGSMALFLGGRAVMLRT